MSVKSNKLFANDVNDDLFGNDSANGTFPYFSALVIPSILNFEVKDSQDESDWFLQSVAGAKVVGRTSSSNDNMFIDEDDTLVMTSQSSQTTSYLDESKTFYSDSYEHSSTESYDEYGMSTYSTETQTRLMLGAEEMYSDYHETEYETYSDEFFSYFTNGVTDATLQSTEDGSLMNVEHSEQNASNSTFATEFDNFFESLIISMSNDGSANISFEMQLESTELDFVYFNANQSTSYAEGIIEIVDNNISLEFACKNLSLDAGQPITTSFKIDNLTSSDDFFAALDDEEVPYQIADNVENLIEIAENIQAGSEIGFSDISTIGITEEGEIYDVA